MNFFKFIKSKVAVSKGDVTAVPIFGILNEEIFLSNGMKISFFEEQKKYLPIGSMKDGSYAFIRDPKLQFWFVMDRGRPTGVYICSGPHGFSARGIVTGREEYCPRWSGAGNFNGFLSHLIATDFFTEEAYLNNNTRR